MGEKSIMRVRVLTLSVVAALIVALLLPGSAPADDWGIVKRVDTRVKVRAKRSEKARITCRLKPGTQVKVDFLEDSWWAVFRLSETRRGEEHALGYVQARYLKPLKDSSMTVITIPDDDKEKAPSQ